MKHFGATLALVFLVACADERLGSVEVLVPLSGERAALVATGDQGDVRFAIVAADGEVIWREKAADVLPHYTPYAGVWVGAATDAGLMMAYLHHGSASLYTFALRPTEDDAWAVTPARTDLLAAAGLERGEGEVRARLAASQAGRLLIAVRLGDERTVTETLLALDMPWSVPLWSHPVPSGSAHRVQFTGPYALVDAAIGATAPDEFPRTLVHWETGEPRYLLERTRGDCHLPDRLVAVVPGAGDGEWSLTSVDLESLQSSTLIQNLAAVDETGAVWLSSSCGYRGGNLILGFLAGTSEARSLVVRSLDPATATIAWQREVTGADDERPELPSARGEDYPQHLLFWVRAIRFGPGLQTREEYERAGGDARQAAAHEGIVFYALDLETGAMTEAVPFTEAARLSALPPYLTWLSQGAQYLLARESLGTPTRLQVFREGRLSPPLELGDLWSSAYEAIEQDRNSRDGVLWVYGPEDLRAVELSSMTFRD